MGVSRWLPYATSLLSLLSATPRSDVTFKRYRHERVNESELAITRLIRSLHGSTGAFESCSFQAADQRGRETRSVEVMPCTTTPTLRREARHTTALALPSSSITSRSTTRRSVPRRPDGRPASVVPPSAQMPL